MGRWQTPQAADGGARRARGAFGRAPPPPFGWSPSPSLRDVGFGTKKELAYTPVFLVCSHWLFDIVVSLAIPRGASCARNTGIAEPSPPAGAVPWPVRPLGPFAPPGRQETPGRA